MRYDGDDLVIPKPITNSTIAVALVPSDALGPQAEASNVYRVERSLNALGLVILAGG
jgi:hypothetical protein